GRKAAPAGRPGRSADRTPGRRRASRRRPFRCDARRAPLRRPKADPSARCARFRRPGSLHDACRLIAMPAQRAQDGMTTSEPPITAIVVTGPTASGKSAAALRIATAFGGTVINADSMQVYRELRILTARPTPEEEAAAPHRLYGVLSAAEACSAGRWRGWAVREIAAASATGSLPVVVGGTGLYLKALLEGLAPIPDTPAEVRERVRSRLREQGAAALFAELAERDPPTAERISPSDTQRILRGLEVLEATGEPLSVWQRRSPRADAREIRTLALVLAPPREAVYAACDARFDRMLEAGALDEVARLAAMRLPPDLPAMRAVGV